MLPSEQTNTIEQFFEYVNRNEAYFTDIYAYHTNVILYLRLITFTQTLPQMSFHLYFVCYFYFALGPMTPLTAGALTDPQIIIMAEMAVV